MARILRCSTSSTALCGDCLTVSQRCGERGRRGGCLYLTSAPQGLSKFIKMSTNGRDAAFLKVTGFSEAKKKKQTKKSFELQVNLKKKKSRND